MKTKLYHYKTISTSNKTTYSIGEENKIIEINVLIYLVPVILHPTGDPRIKSLLIFIAQVLPQRLEADISFTR